MILTSLLQYSFGRIVTLILNFKSITVQLIKSITTTSEADIDEDISEMGDNIWFDGVDKRLIEVHSKKIEVSKGNKTIDEDSLLTNEPLISYRGIVKRRKEQNDNKKHIKDKTTSDIELTNGNASSSKSKKAKKNGKDQSQTTDNGLNLSEYMLRPSSNLTEEVALDCEMVECYGHKSVLARVSIVNLFGRTILDTFVAPPAQITDYRTRWSGIRAKDLINAPSFETVQAQVARIIKDRIVIGHAVHNDFQALMLQHPTDKIRDTSPYFGKHYCLGKTPSLKRLCYSILGLTIQTGEHDSVQDARATMKLYVKARERWNGSCLKGQQNIRQSKVKKQKTKPQKKKVKAFFVETL